MLVNLGLDEFFGAKMSMRQTFSEFIPKKLCFRVKIEILISVKKLKIIIILKMWILKIIKNIKKLLEFIFMKRSRSLL